MGIKTKNISALFGDVKARSIIIFTAVIVFIGVGIGITGMQRSAHPINAQSRLGQTPDIQSIPGVGSTPPASYIQAQTQQNIEQAQEAQQTGASVVPTIVGRLEQVQQPTAAQIRAAEASFSQTGSQTQQATTQTVSKVAVPVVPAAAEQAQVTLTPEQEQNALQALENAMGNQAKSIFDAWKPVAQTYVQGSNEKNQGGASSGGTSSSTGENGTSGTGGPSSQQTTIIKAGTVLYGVLITSVDSDEPSPVMAKIVTGTFKDGTLVGSLKRVNKKVILNFNVLSIASQPSSIGIQAVAIDPNTARTALASSVNSHYLLRYGTVFASAFIQGYGQAIQQSGSTSTPTLLGNQTTMRTLSPKEELAVAAGQIGQTMSQQMGQILNTPPTVRVNPGIGIGILFQQDVNI